MKIKVRVIRVDGTEEHREVSKHNAIQELAALGGWESFDTVRLPDGMVMLVDDTGLVDGKPRNEKATEIYRSVTRPGDHYIAGDVAIVRDADFE